MVRSCVKDRIDGFIIPNIVNVIDQFRISCYFSLQIATYFFALLFHYIADIGYVYIVIFVF